MNLNQFLAELAQRGIKLWLENDTLRFRAPKGVMTSEDRDLLVLHKAKIISLLSQNKTSAKDTAQTIVTVSEKREIPLSFPQEQLWFLSQLDPNNVSYNELFALRFLGVLNIVTLEQSLNKIVARHAALRTNFATVNGQPVQVIAESLILTVPVIDLSNLPASNREIEVQRLATEQAQKPFNLVSDPLIQATVLKLTETEHIFLLRTHHIVWDGWSLGIMWRELAAFYNDLSQELPPLPAEYPDFAVWQRQYLTGEVLDSLQTYWKEQLLDAPPLLELPTDRARGVTQTFRGKHYRFVISKPLTEALIGFSRRQKVTLFMTLLSAFQTLLYRYTGQTDLCVGSPIANRDRAEFKDLIGYFVNTLVLRTCLAGNPSFEDLLSRVRRVMLGAYANRELPFEKLVEILQPERSLSYTPLFQVMLMLLNELPDIQMEGLKVSPLAVETGIVPFDLTLCIETTPSGLIGEWEYNTDLFDDTTIARMAGHFQTLLEGIIANPQAPISDLPLLTQQEQYQLLFEWNNTTTEYPQNKCIHELFEGAVERSPDAVAVVFEGERLTYRELNARANHLAHYLRSLGVGPEVLVGICVERSLEMVIGLLGILKAGGAYVPLDPEYPKERLAFMLEDSSVPVLLTQQKLVEKLPPNSARVICLDSDWEEISFHSQNNPLSEVQPENLAYVIYTSGSTGKPKGVLIEHKSLVNYTTVAIAEYEISKRDRILQFSSISFDVSAEEIYSSLTSGATLVLRTDTMLDSFEVFLHKCQNWEITVLAVPTAYWHELTAFLSQKTLALPPSLRLVIIGGEKALPERLKPWFECIAQQVRLLNNYGPTEASIGATIYELLADDTALRELPIGRPLGNVQTYILDRNKQPVPIGVPGELHIGGVGLARGYLNRPDLTAERFIRNPFSDSPTERLYKTGDRVRYLPDGNIEYLGRIDDQVKVRGFRIELGEIEAVLAKHPNVRSVTVIDREDAPGNKRIVAYLVSNLIPERVPYHSECQLELNGNAITIHTQDISTGGVGLVGVPAIEQGKSVRVRMQLPGESESRWLSGTVVWSHPPQAGIRFLLTPSEQAQIDQSVDYQLDNQDLWKTLQRTVTRNLRHYLKQKLPDYMIPSAFVLIKALPVTPNGKIDRRALPALDNFHNEQEDQFVAPGTPTEAKMAAIWAEVLGLKRVGINDNFFELGGHSLLATQIISRIGQVFAIELPLRHLFEAPTIASLCNILETEYATTLQELSDYSIASQSLPPLVPTTRKGHLPLSIQQEYIWHVQQLNPHNCSCNSGVALRLTFKVSSEALEKSINEIICRHESLRTTFPVVDGQPVQAIAPELTLPLKIVDLQNIPSAKREAEALHFSEREMNYHFDLANGPLIKATLVRLSSEEHWLLIPMHHIITDGWSIGIFVQELETIYNAFSNNLPSPLPELPLQYADFTLWQRQRFNEEVLARQLDYWVQKLAAPLQQSGYQQDRESKINSNSDRASSYSLVLEGNIVASLEDLSRFHNVTISTIIIAALKLLLFKWSGQSEIMILATIGNRSTPEIEKMLGCFINDVILRSQLNDEQTGITLLEQVQEALNEAIENKAIPLQKVIEVVQRQRKLIVSASVTIVPPVEGSNQMPVSELVLGSDKDKLWDEEIPLELYISSASEKSKSIEIHALYSRDLFARETIERLFSYYQEVLQNLASSPQMKIAEFEQFQKEIEKEANEKFPCLP
ncbi:amino acid adenylation domain-containing protein [Trichocoleus sp. DQ-U1]|uniref:amino acid adenylation domain-containing protein n=1 Tax=Trichocoleus sp. DQ-U1 TaxID=2933926 RepID=UPI00329770D5